MSNKRYPVLHVDDDPAITRLVCSLLRKKGIEAIELNDPQLALEFVLRHVFRVVLLDIDMPGVNGMELLTDIKRRDGGVNVIVLTGLISQATAIMAMRRGALACLFKPLNDLEPLLDAIQAGFDNSNRWQKTLRQLAEIKQQHRQVGQSPVTAADAASEE